MRTLLALLVLGILCAGIVMSGGKAYAQQYPQVSGLQPFTPPTVFMSLPGYLRWQIFAEQGKWISHQEAAEAASQQR